MKMPETAENCCGRIEEIACEDMISALPDDLLVTILLSIPTKDAVATMILSKRWRFIWTMVPFLAYKEIDDDGDDGGDFDDFDDLDDDVDSDDDDDDDDEDEHDGDDDSKKSVWWFLNKSMEFHKAPVLAILSIKLGPQCPTDANVGKLVESAINRIVWVLFFKLMWSTDPTRMPNSLYTCKTLMHLKLSHKILVDPPSSSCLPSLTNLDLYYVVYKDEASLGALLSSCPVLEFLCVKRKEDDNIATFSVKVPSLRFLSYRNYKSLPDNSDDVVDTSRSLIMDTPALRDFYITDRSGDSFAINNMSRLQYAYVKVKYFPDKLLRSLSAVFSLELVLTDEMVSLSLSLPLSLSCYRYTDPSVQSVPDVNPIKPYASFFVFYRRKYRDVYI